jgi:hypothetical protein
MFQWSIIVMLRMSIFYGMLQRMVVCMYSYSYNEFFWNLEVLQFFVVTIPLMNQNTCPFSKECEKWKVRIYLLF